MAGNETLKQGIGRNQMKYPCVELYFEMEPGPLHIRIWLKTNNQLKDGAIDLAYYLEMDEIKATIQRQKIVEKERMVRLLSAIDSISAFQVTYRHDMNCTGVVVYREWP